jgi:hypothetical protein
MCSECSVDRSKRVARLERQAAVLGKIESAVLDLQKVLTPSPTVVAGAAVTGSLLLAGWIEGNVHLPL